MAAVCRHVVQQMYRNGRLLASPVTFTAVTRGRKKWASQYYREMYHRRLEAGPEPERPKSVWLNWNYDAEVFAFGKRLGEDFNEETLKTAFTDESYIQQELKRRKELGVEEVALNMQSNSSLFDAGQELTANHIRRFLRFSYPYLPEEGIRVFSDFLMSEKTLSHVAYNLGIKDIILCEEFPVPTETVVKSFMAVIGGLAKDQGEERAKIFVQDFILTQLIGEDLRELWTMVNPMGILSDVLEKQNRGLPEPRLIGEAGGHSVMGCYVVGIYSDKELIGEAPGETPTIAEEMAAKDALVNMFGLSDNRPSLKFKAPPAMIDSYQENLSLSEGGGKHIASS